MKVLIFTVAVFVCLLELTAVAVAEAGCTKMEHCNHTVCTSDGPTQIYELHCIDNNCVCQHVIRPPQTCSKANGDSDCTTNTCTRHDFGPIHYAMKCLHRNGQDECHCTATYNHGGHHHGGPGSGTLGN